MKLIQEIFSFVLVYAPWVIYMFAVPRMLHMLQLEGYKFKDYVRWLGKNFMKAFKPGLIQLAFTGGFAVFVTALNYILSRYYPTAMIHKVFLTEYLCMFLVFAVVNIKQIRQDKKFRKTAKKTLVYTSRAKRLMVWNLALLALLYISFLPYNPIYFSSSSAICLYYMTELEFFTAMIAILPFNIVIANFLAYPTEMAAQERYKRKAEKKLCKKQFNNLIRIGITGSYGKTSSKYILKTILSEKYNVYATPESYNTSMGNAKVILENLGPQHEVFISEMGARYKGDIEEICDFVMPDYGWITSIGPQHLETFGTIENVAKTKAELLNELPKEGFVVLPRDNGECQKLYSKELREKVCYTIENSNADVYAKDIVLDEKGCSFTAHTPIGNIKCVTKLLGEHNVSNILGAIALSIKLGLTAEEIERGVAKIEPIEHRLQIIDNGNGTIVIDDAFNSNPVGSKMALDVLSKFKGRKIIVTPGMVELGIREESENKQFGKNMAKVVDIAILVGLKRSRPIVEGLKAGKFDDMNIHVVADLNAATAKLAELTKVGDVILFENDLPDNYNEQ